MRFLQNTMNEILSEAISRKILTPEGLVSKYYARMNKDWLLSLVEQKLDKPVAALYLALNPGSNICRCGNPTTFVSYAAGFRRNCSIRCVGDDTETKKARANKLMERFGVDTPYAAGFEKRIKTNLERYGAPSPFQSEAVISRIKEKNKSRHGAENPFTFSAQKIVESRRNTYLASAAWQQKLADIAAAGIEWVDSEYSGCTTEYTWHHNKCGTTWSQWLYGTYLPTCPACKPVSKPQEEVASFIRDLGFETFSSRKIISPYELDIVVKDTDIAVEVNGTFWHGTSKARSSRISLGEKTELARAAGYKLIHIWDIDWQMHQAQIKHRLRLLLGKGERLEARKLQIKWVKPAEVRDFFAAHHTQGFARGSDAVCLLDNDTIISCFLVGKPRYTKGADIELIRYASSRRVIGGPEKLLKELKTKYHGKTLLSYSDANWSNGSLYQKLGFSYAGTTSTGYFWAKGSQKLTRYQTQPKKLPSLLGPAYIQGASEKRNMIENGWILCENVKDTKWILKM